MQPIHYAEQHGWPNRSLRRFQSSPAIDAGPGDEEHARREEAYRGPAGVVVLIVSVAALLRSGKNGATRFLITYIGS